jgi:hypothetical protein
MIEAENVKLTSFQKIIAVIGITSALAILPYSVVNQKIDTQSEGLEQKGEENSEEGEEDED